MLSWTSGAGVLSLSALSVISARGVAGTLVGSGEADGCGVGSWETSSTGAAATDARDLRVVFPTVRFFGDCLFVGDNGSAVLAGVNNCVGSMLSSTRVRRLAVGFGVAVSSTAFDGLPRRTIFCGAGAGVNSSSLSCLILGAWFSSSSESSTMGAFRRVAAARVDLRGDTADIFAGFWGG